MSDFKKMAEEAKAESDARRAAIIEEQKRVREASLANFTAATNYLDSVVRPILEDAASEFHAVGVPAKISGNWEVGSRPVEPSLTFRCEGPRISNSYGGHEIPQGVAVAVTRREDGSITVAAGKASGLKGEVALEDQIAAALKTALDSYLKSREEIETRS